MPAPQYWRIGSIWELLADYAQETRMTRGEFLAPKLRRKPKR